MIIWSIQPLTVYEQIIENGIFHCDFSLSDMQEFKKQYDWMSRQMIKRIGPNPNTQYSIWGWYRMDYHRKKPNLEWESRHYGGKGDQLVCMEMDIPSNQVLLSDLDAWDTILSNGFLADNEEEYSALCLQYNALSPYEKDIFLEKNWERVFQTEFLKNDLISRGRYVQATFWEIKSEYIGEVDFFTAV